MNLEKIFDSFEKLMEGKFKIYRESAREKDGDIFFMVKDEKKKYLVILGDEKTCDEFDGSNAGELSIDGEKYRYKIVKRNHDNLKKLREKFPSLNPSRCGLKPSFGTGDRLGIATPAHIIAFEKYGKDLFPFLAQQSVRERMRTKRSWDDVLDDAIWGVFERGYDGEFGADADHVKTLDELEGALKVGYTMFTIDPSDYVRDPRQMKSEEKRRVYKNLDGIEDIERVYLGRRYEISGESLIFDESNLVDIALTYLDAINHVEKMFKFLKESKKEEFDFEVSVDETSTPTSPLAHIFIVEELRRRNVEFTNLALRFVGDWQKAIDYIGDLNLLDRELHLHGEIARKFGGYKLSLHSGSDKFSVYPLFYKNTEGLFHVKTAGTSYLEEIKVIAMKDPKLYREIHKFALTVFERDRASYHVTTDLSKIPNIDELSDDELMNLFNDPNSRQLIHITYGSVLNAKDEDGNYRFKDRIFRILFKNEEEHYHLLSEHIGKHLKLLKP